MDRLSFEFVLRDEDERWRGKPLEGLALVMGLLWGSMEVYELV